MTAHTAAMSFRESLFRTHTSWAGCNQTLWVSVGTRLYLLGLPDELPGAVQCPACMVSPDLLGRRGGGHGRAFLQEVLKCCYIWRCHVWILIPFFGDITYHFCQASAQEKTSKLSFSCMFVGPPGHCLPWRPCGFSRLNRWEDDVWAAVQPVKQWFHPFRTLSHYFYLLFVWE